MKRNNELLTKLETMKKELEFFLENVTDITEDIEKNIKNLLERINKTIENFKNENTNEIETLVLKLEEEFNEWDLEIPTVHYYDFGYFFGRKDSGSCYVKLMCELNTDDIDTCVEIALRNNALDEEFAGNIVYIEELTEEEARDFVLV